MWKPALGIFLQLTLPSPATGAWPTFQGSPAHTGHTLRSPLEQPRIVWRQPIGLMGVDNFPLIAHGQVFAGSSGRVWNRSDPELYQKDLEINRHGDGIYAFDYTTGRPQWFSKTSGDVNGLAWSQGLLVFSSGFQCECYQRSGWGEIGVLNASTGESLWSYTVDHPDSLFSHPLIVEQQVIVGNAQGHVTAFEIHTGQVLWQQTLPGPIASTPAWDGKTLYVTTRTGHVMALNPQGKPLWHQTLSHPYPATSQRTDSFPLEFAATPTVVGHSLYLSFARNDFYPHPAMVALDTATGKVRWWAQDPHKLLPQHANLRSSPAVWGDYLLIGTPYTPTALQINRHTGVLAAVLPMGYPTIPQWPSPAINGHQLILPRHDGYVYAWDLLQQKLQWRLYLGTPEEAGKTFPVTSKAPHWMPTYGDAIYTSPAIGPDGSILVGANGYLYRIGSK